MQQECGLKCIAVIYISHDKSVAIAENVDSKCLKVEIKM